MDNDRGPEQAAPGWSTQANASSSDGDNDSIKFAARSVEDDDVKMDEAHDSGTRLHATPTPTLVHRIAAVEEDEAMDVASSVIDRASPKEVEMQGLGPVENFDAELFEVVHRPVTNHPSAALTKDVLVCKFCNAEFPYGLRDVDQHKLACKAYKEQSGAATDATAMDDADLPTLLLDGDAEADESVEDDDEAGGQHDESSSSLTSDSEERTDEEEASAKDGGGGDRDSVEDDEDETQMLDDSEPEILPACQDLRLKPLTPLPTLAVAKKRADHEAEDASVAAGDDHQLETAQQDETRGDSDGGDHGVEGDDMGTGGVEDVAGAGGGEDEGVDDGSVGNGSTISDVNGDDAAQASTPNSFFRVIDEAKSDRVECLLCGKDFSSRASAMTAHRKKCRPPKPTPQNQSITRDGKPASHLLLTPQKKPAAKRRINQELDKLEGEVITTTKKNPFGLRERNRSKADASEAAATVATTPALTLASATTTLAAASELGAQGLRPTSKRDDSLWDQFDPVGDHRQAKRMTCKHCKVEVAMGPNQGRKHLSTCDAYKASVGEATVTPAKRRVEASTGEQGNQKRSKTTSALFGKGAATGSGAQIQRRFEELTVERVLALDAETLRAWIFGSAQKAEEMQNHYRAKPLVVRGPAARFRALRDALCELDVKKLLDATPTGTKFTKISKSMSGAQPSYMKVLPSREHALASYQQGKPIAFRPPETVVQALVPRLAEDVGCGPFVPTEMHDVELICSQGRFTLNWQLLTCNTIVVCLQGKFLWKMQRGPVKNPPTSVHTPSGPSLQLAEQLKALVSATKVGTKPTAFAPPVGNTFDFTGDQGDGGDDMDDEGRPTSQSTTAASLQAVVDAGSVVYMPPGTWYQARVLEDSEPCVLLRIQLKAGGIGAMLMEAMRKVVTTDEWRENELNAVGCADTNEDQLVDQLVRDAFSKLQAMQSTEVVPKLLRRSGGATPTETVVAEDGKSLTKIFEFDLTDRTSFQGGKDLQLLEGSMFRVNTLAAMLTMEEWTQFCPGASSSTSSAMTASSVFGASTPATSKKALNRKQKRPASTTTHASSSESSNHQGVFVLVWGSREATQMLVKFRCSQPQQDLVEWIRSRDTSEEIFMGQLKMILKAAQGGTTDIELLKLTVRFLCTVGYLTNVEVPLRDD